MKDLYFLKGWNNYSNRILKTTERDIGDFLNLYPDTTYEVRPSINFNPADGVKTGVTVNWGLPWTPSYLIVADDSGVIFSTWFVMEFERNLVGQYRALLRRDVLNDFKHDILTATSYVEKGTLPPSSPLIFNKENVGLNQIKKSETLLKDTTNSAWVVGYVSKKDVPGADEQGKRIISTDILSKPNYTAATFPFPNLLPTADTKTYTVNGSFNKCVVRFRTTSPKNAYEVGLLGPNYYINTIPDSQALGLPELFNGNNEPIAFNIGEALYQEMESTAYSQANVFTPERLIEFLNMNNKILQTADGKTYKIGITNNKDGKTYIEGFGSGSTFALSLQNALVSPRTTLINSGRVTVYGICNTYTITFTESWEGDLYTIFTNTRTRCTDAPYDMFAIPYNAIKVSFVRGQDVEEFDVDPDSAIAIAQAIQVQLTDSYVYDVQLLPYCPIPDIGTGDGIDLSKLGDGTLSTNTAWQIVSLASYPRNVLLWCRNSIGNLTIPYNHPAPVDSMELKVANQAQMTRICSPNYAGMFEMSAAKNEGIQYMDINFTYKPYNPFIHVAPNFKGLYGASFNDARGLICGGDFSLAKLNDAWANYELQNKNYQAIFDRNIQSMDVMHSYDRIELGIGAFTGTAGGAAGGAMAGGLVGGPGGALIGGVAGGVVSAIGGIADFALGEARYKEQRALSIDQFGLQLDNIKALPTTLSKTTALTNNNKIWPFVEEYDCTDEEKEAFRNKLTYDGMTIGIVGEFKDYVVEGTKSYVKGRIIRFRSDFSEDDHLANTIFNEALMGFYTEG